MQAAHQLPAPHAPGGARQVSLGRRRRDRGALSGAGAGAAGRVGGERHGIDGGARIWRRYVHTAHSQRGRRGVAVLIDKRAPRVSGGTVPRLSHTQRTRPSAVRTLARTRALHATGSPDAPRVGRERALGRCTPVAYAAAAAGDSRHVGQPLLASCRACGVTRVGARCALRDSGRATPCGGAAASPALCTAGVCGVKPLAQRAPRPKVRRRAPPAFARCAARAWWLTPRRVGRAAAPGGMRLCSERRRTALAAAVFLVLRPVVAPWAPHPPPPWAPDAPLKPFSTSIRCATANRQRRSAHTPRTPRMHTHVHVPRLRLAAPAHTHAASA
jgi:hypothetical protein